MKKRQDDARTGRSGLRQPSAGSRIAPVFLGRHAAVLLSAVLMGGWLSCTEEPAPPPTPPEPPPGKLTVLVPDDMSNLIFTPPRARGALEQDIVHNLYDGLFNPQADQGYGQGLATDVDFGLLAPDGQSSGRSEATVQLTHRPRRWHVSGETGSGEEIDAFDVMQAWQKISRDPSFPGRGRFTSVIDSIEAIDETSLRVVFKTRMEWTTRSQEALGFRLFDPLRTERIPKGSGPFVLDIPAPSDELWGLKPSANYLSGLPDRPDIFLRSVPSPKNRLDQVMEGKAQVALDIPPYYMERKGSAQANQMDRYNVWALIFSPKLDRKARRWVAHSLDEDRLLDAFLLLKPNAQSFLDTLGLDRPRLLTRSIFPSNFEVFECALNQRAQKRLADKLAETLDWIEGGEAPGTPQAAPFVPSPLRIAIRDGGAFQEGVNKLSTELEDQLEARAVSDARIDMLPEGEWRRAVEKLADRQASTYHAALVRFQYDRRCDVSLHFQAEKQPTLEGGGLFYWVTKEPGGGELAWNSAALSKLRDAGYCDAVVEPALQVAEKVRELAPARFLFTVPSLIVFDGRISVSVNDEFVLARMSDWKYTGSQ